MHYARRVWNLEYPGLLINITGGAQFIWKGDEKDKVLYQLIDAAHCSNGWIVTGGSDAGIMKYVGMSVLSKNIRKAK